MCLTTVYVYAVHVTILVVAVNSDCLKFNGVTHSYSNHPFLWDIWETTSRSKVVRLFCGIKFTIEVSSKIIQFVILDQEAAVIVLVVGKLENSRVTHMCTQMTSGQILTPSVKLWVKRFSCTILHPQNTIVRRSTNQNMYTKQNLQSLSQRGIPCPSQSMTHSQMYWVKISPATCPVTPLVRGSSQA